MKPPKEPKDFKYPRLYAYMLYTYTDAPRPSPYTGVIGTVCDNWVDFDLAIIYPNGRIDITEESYTRPYGNTFFAKGEYWHLQYSEEIALLKATNKHDGYGVLNVLKNQHAEWHQEHVEDEVTHGCAAPANPTFILSFLGEIR